MARRSDNVTRGIEKAPMRSLFYAMGYTKEELENMNCEENKDDLRRSKKSNR